MREHIFRCETRIPRPLSEVFDFFCRAENLEQMTPSSVRFKILTPLPIDIRQGTEIDYVIHLGPVPMRWKTLISKWDPPHGFVDEQLRGPYLKWHHEHRFRDEGDSTWMEDVVTYRVPGGPFEPIIHGIYVGREVEKIFAFRTKAIQEIFKA